MSGEGRVMGDPVGVARYLLQAICSRPGEARVEHVWTPTADLLFLRITGAAKKRLKQEGLAALVRVVERLGADGERELVVDLK